MLFVYTIVVLFFFFFLLVCFVFFFQAEDGIRDRDVTGVQTVLFRSCSRNLESITKMEFVRPLEQNVRYENVAKVLH